MKKKVTAIFDIGKTNKKFFLLDADYLEVYREYIQIQEIEDEDGYPCENLQALVYWMKNVFGKMLQSAEFEVCSLNFSCYGASLVHLGEDGEALTPLYNYLKPIPEEVQKAFYTVYGPEDEFSRATGSLKMGMLNSGMQLFWLKHGKPKIFKKIKYTLHLPQYLSYVFTGMPVSEHTSIGCHTLLWDYDRNNYHPWVFNEQLDILFPPIVSTNTTFNTIHNGNTVQVGVGIHDSSAALLPYIKGTKKPFLLLSTGTWSITINPLANTSLTFSEIKDNCQLNMQGDGSPVKVARLFLGNEHAVQVKKLAVHYRVPADYHRSLIFDPEVFHEVCNDDKPKFEGARIVGGQGVNSTGIADDSFEKAYHRLVYELVLLQVASIQAAKGDQNIDRLYVDGGFADNGVFMHILSHCLNGMACYASKASLGSALGAAVAIGNKTFGPKFLKRNYGLKKQVVVQLK